MAWRWNVSSMKQRPRSTPFDLAGRTQLSSNQHPLFHGTPPAALSTTAPKRNIKFSVKDKSLLWRLQSEVESCIPASF
ncbi:hypothetical protein V6N13_000885 [Hibiscus sabdariffa]